MAMPTPLSRYDSRLPPSSRYGASSSGYGAPSSRYGAPSSRYDAPSSRYEASSSSRYNAPSSRYDSRYLSRAPSTRRDANQTFATPLTAERAMMERIRSKLERTQVRLANDQARSSVQQQEALMGSHHYYPPDYASTRAPAPPVPSMRVEDLASSRSKHDLPPSSRFFGAHDNTSNTRTNTNSNMYRSSSRPPETGSSRWRMSRYGDEKQRPNGSQASQGRQGQAPLNNYQSSAMLPPPASSSSYVVYSSARGSIPMEELFPQTQAPPSQQPKSILMRGSSRSQRYLRSSSSMQSAGEDAASIPAPPPSSRVRFQETLSKGASKKEVEDPVEYVCPPLVEEEEEDDDRVAIKSPKPKPKPQVKVEPESPKPKPQVKVEPESPKPKPQVKVELESPKEAKHQSPVNRAPKPRQDDTRRSLVAEPPKSAIKISAFDKFFGHPFWVPKSKREKEKKEQQDEDIVPRTRQNLPQSPIASAAGKTLSPKVASPSPRAPETPETHIEKPNAGEDTTSTPQPAPKISQPPPLHPVQYAPVPMRTPAPMLERISESSPRPSDAAPELTPAIAHAENASTLVVLDTEEEDATFLSTDEYIPSGGEPSFEPTSGPDDATFVLPSQCQSKRVEDPISDDDEEDYDDDYDDYEPPINSTTSSCLSDECLPPHLAYLLEGNEEEEGDENDAGASYTTDDGQWPSGLNSVHPLSNDAGEDTGAENSKKPPPSSLSNDLEYLLALSKACQGEYASSNRDSMFSSCSEPSDVYSSNNSISVLPSPPPSTRERALSDPQSIASMSPPPSSAYLPRARPVVTSTVQCMTSRERWIDDEPLSNERWIDDEAEAEYDREVDVDKEIDVDEDAETPRAHAGASTQHMMPSRLSPPPPLQQRSSRMLSQQPLQLRSSRMLTPPMLEQRSSRSMMPPPSTNAPTSIMRDSSSRGMLNSSYANASGRGAGVIPPSASLLMSSPNPSLRGLQPPPSTTATMLSSSRTSLRASIQSQRHQPPQTGTMLSTSYASMRSSYARTLPRGQSAMLPATATPAPPATTRPSVSRPRGVSNVTASNTPPPSTYVPLRQRAKTVTSSRRPMPPSIGALSSLAQGSTEFKLDPSRFYQLEWTTGEFAFSFQRVYGPADPNYPTAPPPMFLRMLLNTERGTCPNFKHVHVGDVLVQIGTTRVCDLGVDSSTALTKLFAHLQRQMPMPLVFQRMDADEWEGGVEL